MSHVLAQGPTISSAPTTRRWPAPWLFGVLILPLGMYIGFLWTALPFLLAKAKVPVEDISRVAAILQLPPLLMFLWTPVVDVKLRRRTWLIFGALATAFSLWLTNVMLLRPRVGLITAILFVGGCVAALVAASGGGLMANLLSPAAQSSAAGWNQAGNFGGGVLGAAVVLWLTQRVAGSVVGLATAAMVALPALAALTLGEAPPASSHWFQGRLDQMGREFLSLLRSPRRRWGVVLAIAPCSTAAAQPLLPALASHYGVGANGVLWTNGVAGGILLAFGSLCTLVIPGAWDRRLTYAGAGLINAVGAFVLLAANRPSTYYWGTLVYLLTAGLCNARFVALALDVIGTDVRDAGTWYSALLAASNIPIASMIWLEGMMFHRFGTHGLLWTDAGANLLVFAVVAVAFLSRGVGLRTDARPRI
jgi:hypothetical protein